MRGRHGFTVMEALVALLVGWMLTTLALGTFARQRTVQARLARRGEALAALRIGRHVLGTEIRSGDGTEAVGADSIALRAFRGIGVVCAPSGDVRVLVVRLRGIRLPDPTKDSVAVVGTQGGVRVVGLESRAPAGPCADDGEDAVERWHLSGDAPSDPLVARYFERGSYHLSGGALRYRRGGAGRQPLTPEVLRTPPSGFRVSTAGLEAQVFLDHEDPATPAHAFSLGRGGSGTGGG